ncbi:MAG: tripartite tricarboxylate transporter substrate binding protein [candidate division NC10 bacterium]|nr:tripartite tricarboxylate transporter substrate binding protein [candidate division NC10 bacterium]
MWRRVILSLLGLCVLWATGVAAQGYPTKPIQMIVAFPAGGNTDLMARALAPGLGKELGQPIVIVNKGGVGGVVGSTDLARSRPDGYTIMLSPNSPLTILPHQQKLTYTLDSFRFVCLTYDNPFVLAAGPQAPFKTFAEFVTFAKAKPNNVAYASGGPGSMPHLLFLDIFRQIGAEGVHIPFTGAGPQVQAILGGTVQVMIDSPATVSSNNLPLLAVFAAKRLASMPNVPTMQELGLDLKAFSAGGLIVPAGTPDAVVATLDRACVKATESEGYLGTLAKLKAAARHLPADRFRELFVEDSARNYETIRRAGMLPKP